MALQRLQALAAGMEQASRRWHEQSLQLQRALEQVEEALHGLEHENPVGIDVIPITQTHPSR